MKRIHAFTITADENPYLAVSSSNEKNHPQITIYTLTNGFIDPNTPPYNLNLSSMDDKPQRRDDFFHLLQFTFTSPLPSTSSSSQSSTKDIDMINPPSIPSRSPPYLICQMRVSGIVAVFDVETSKCVHTLTTFSSSPLSSLSPNPFDPSKV